MDIVQLKTKEKLSKFIILQYSLYAAQSHTFTRIYFFFVT